MRPLPSSKCRHTPPHRPSTGCLGSVGGLWDRDRPATVAPDRPDVDRLKTADVSSSWTLPPRETCTDRTHGEEILENHYPHQSSLRWGLFLGEPEGQTVLNPSRATELGLPNHDRLRGYLA